MTIKATTDTQIKKGIKDIIKIGKERNINLVGYTGLSLRVRPNKKGGATSTFIHRYTHPYTKKESKITLGDYPSFTLEQARQTHQDNLALLATNTDPITHRDNEHIAKVKAINNTFDIVANNWLTEEINNKQPKQSTLKGWNIAIKNLLNEFTGYPIAEITPKQILNLCKQLSNYNANRTKGIANRIFAYAVVHDIVEHNPVLELQGVNFFKQKKSREYPALIKPHEFACLLNDIDNIDSIKKTFNKAILQLLALTFVRIGDLCMMKWCDIDFHTKQWTFTPQKGENRQDMVKSLVMPLAPQAIAILKDVQQITADKEYVFYNSRRKKSRYHDHQRVRDTLNSNLMNKQGIGDNYQTGKGYLGVHCPHGFRATAKTMLMERLGYDHLITEIQLGHSMPDKYGLSYSRMELIRERTKMMTEWANYLDELRAGKHSQ